MNDASSQPVAEGIAKWPAGLDRTRRLFCDTRDNPAAFVRDRFAGEADMRLWL